MCEKNLPFSHFSPLFARRARHKTKMQPATVTNSSSSSRSGSASSVPMMVLPIVAPTGRIRTEQLRVRFQAAPVLRPSIYRFQASPHPSLLSAPRSAGFRQTRRTSAPARCCRRRSWWRGTKPPPRRPRLHRPPGAPKPSKRPKPKNRRRPLVLAKGYATRALGTRCSFASVLLWMHLARPLQHFCQTITALQAAAAAGGAGAAAGAGAGGAAGASSEEVPVVTPSQAKWHVSDSKTVRASSVAIGRSHCFSSDEHPLSHFVETISFISLIGWPV